ncbi:MAG: hypothetical protein QM569_12035 [Acidovorax sp.]|uniref:hypothetical protein n=1 Tax=Acidovorax sp. TaxID=1872122 RepID=UPI0039E3ECDD
MQRIPSPFEPRSQLIPSAAGGGSTSTTCCSCCVATLAATVGMSHSVFRRLVNEPPTIEPPPESAAAPSPDAPPAAAEPVNAETLPQDVLQDAPTQPLYPSTFTRASAWGYAWAVLGVLVLTVGLIAAMPPLAVLTGIAGTGAYFGLFVKAYKQAGRSGGSGVAAAFGVQLTLGLILAIEVAVWLGVLFN